MQFVKSHKTHKNNSRQRVKRIKPFLIGIFFITACLSLLTNYTNKNKPIIFTSHAASPQSCGTICDGTHSCGLPLTISGIIVDKQGKGVQGLPVVIYDHNRDNSNYPTAIDTVTTDPDGKYTETGLICGVPTINYGDAYAVRPQWSQCIPGFVCLTPNPGTIENQQALKPGHLDCSNQGGCNFIVDVLPIQSLAYSPSLPTTFIIFGILAAVALFL